MLVLAIALVALLATASLAAAQSDNPPGTDWGRRGGGMMGWNADAGTTGPLHDYMLAAVADELGLTVDELEASLADGTHMYIVAEELGYSFEEWQQIMSDAHQTAVEQALADGVITAEQAEWMNSRGYANPGARMGGMGRGMARGGGFGPCMNQ
jgi:hypothetical protein